VRGLLTGINPGNRTLIEAGYALPGDSVFSPERFSEHIADFDKITLMVPQDLNEGQVIMRGASHMEENAQIPTELKTAEDRLWYVADCAVWCEDEDGVVYSQGVDFEFESKKIRWIGARPYVGKLYTVRYTGYPEWIVYVSPFLRFDNGRSLGRKVLLRKKHVHFSTGRELPVVCEPSFVGSIFDEEDVVAPPIAWEPSFLLPEAEGWWRADKGIAHILLEIVNWVNQGSEPTLDLAQAIVSRRPDLVAAVAALNGQAAAFFDGVDVMASIATAAWELAADGDDLTVIVFLEPTAGSVGGVVSVDAAGAGGFTVRARAPSATLVVTRDSSGGGFLTAGGPGLTLSTPHVFTMVYKGQVSPTVDSMSSWLDGVEGTVSTLDQLRINSSLSPQEFFIGAESLTGSSGFIGHIAEILFLRRLLTSGEDVLLTEYANARYGMVLPGITQ
jgi:hypothetical protein